MIHKTGPSRAASDNVRTRSVTMCLVQVWTCRARSLPRRVRVRSLRMFHVKQDGGFAGNPSRHHRSWHRTSSLDFVTAGSIPAENGSGRRVSGRCAGWPGRSQGTRNVSRETSAPASARCLEANGASQTLPGEGMLRSCRISIELVHQGGRRVTSNLNAVQGLSKNDCVPVPQDRRSEPTRWHQSRSSAQPKVRRLRRGTLSGGSGSFIDDLRRPTESSCWTGRARPSRE